MRTGHVYGRVKLKDGRVATLRSLRRADAQALRDFANRLVDERSRDPDLGILLDRRLTLRDERDFAKRMARGIRKGDIVSVVAVVDGIVAGNSEVTRGHSGDIRHVGRLGIAIDERFRGVGLGRQMLETLIDGAGDAGMSLIILEVFATNSRAISLYESVGFRRYGHLPGGVVRNGKTTDIIQMFRQA